MIEPVTESVVVPTDATGAFRIFAADLASWWPAEYTWSGEMLEHIAIEPRVNGRCYEVGPHDFRCDWGRVLDIDAPRRILLAWQISPSRAPEPNPERASELEVTFEAAPDGGTRVTLEHRAFERHGDHAAEYRSGMAAPAGWPWILGRFAERAAGD